MENKLCIVVIYYKFVQKKINTILISRIYAVLGWPNSKCWWGMSRKHCNSAQWRYPGKEPQTHRYTQPQMLQWWLGYVYVILSKPLTFGEEAYGYFRSLIRCLESSNEFTRRIPPLPQLPWKRLANWLHNAFVCLWFWNNPSDTTDPPIKLSISKVGQFVAWWIHLIKRHWYNFNAFFIIAS